MTFPPPSYAPTFPSRLGSSPSLSLAAPPSSSDAPSSPTTSSFYSTTTRHAATPHAATTTRGGPAPTSTRPRAYKSQASSRTTAPKAFRTSSSSSSSSSSPSSSTNPFRSIHERARLVERTQDRPRPRATRSLELGTSIVPDEPGGWTAAGEWEEFDDHERERLEIEMLNHKKQWKWEMRLKDEEAEDAMLDPDDEDADMLPEQEPPLDVLSDYEPPPPSPPRIDDDDSIARLPSLASSISSSPFLGAASSLASPTGSEFEDASMALSAPVAVPLPPSTVSPPEPPHLESSVRAFEECLVASACPACKRADTPIRGDASGAQCSACGWGIAIEVLRPLETAFARHGSAVTGHLPIFSYTPFTDTLVFCQACDEEFAA
ncbi:hypothetical protein JCM10212_005664 [Sporobolomyces blumeae]